MKFTKKQIEQLIKDIYSGVYNPSDNLPEGLYFAIGRHLENAVFEGFGTDFGGEDLQLAEDLRTNTWLFSGAKTYQFTRESTEILSELSKLLSQSPTFKDFKKAVLPVYEKYNVDWLKAEYNTAIGQSKQARQWNDFERNKEVFPYLRYNAVMDANTSTICRPLDGVTLPVDDPMWNKYSPLNHFNCFTPETKILTPDGWINIENINKNDLVIGGSGKPQYIIGIHINSIDDEILQIGIKNNSVSSTKNHRFLTLQGWKRAENICINDIIVQNIQVGIFNKIICTINNSYAIATYLLMSIIRKGKAAMVNTFNSNIKVGQKNINKSSINKLIAYTMDVFTNKKIKNFLFAFGQCFMILPIFFGIGIIGLYGLFIRLFSNIKIKHWIRFTHTFGSVGSFFAKHWMWKIVSNFRKPFGCFNLSFGIINPLSFNSFASLSGADIKFYHESHNSSVINRPFVTNLPIRKHIGNISKVEGFTNGQPLNRFNSLFDFICHSFFHRKFINVSKIDRINYTGQIYNLSVKNDESYITNVGVVHNCRCVLEKIDKYEDVKLTPKSEVDKLTKELNETVQPEFKMNPGKDGYVFSGKHPYFEVAPKDKDFAKRNFDLPIPESDLAQKIKFEPAKSIKEAEEYAKNNIANYVQFNVTDKHLYGINQMNEELGSLLSEYKKFSFGERDKLNSLIVKAFNSKKELGRSGFADYSGNISMNQFALLNSEKSIELLRKQAEAGILIKVKKGDEIKAIVRHEFAHTLWQKTSINEITDTAKEFQKKINSLYKQYLNEPNAFIGSYSKTNVDEFFAEHFAAAKYGKQTKYTKIVSELTKKYFK